MKPPLVVIAGPTASGKSALALDLAARTGGVIVNADASQVYADLRILSARPSPADEAAADHRLYGMIDGAVACSAAMWAGLARAEIAAIHAAGRLPILVGGTGMYLRTLLDGIAPVPEIDPEVRVAVRALPAGDLHALLAAEDPAMAARLRPSDPQRLARALEVVRSTGRSLADWQAAPTAGLAAAVELHGHVVEIDRDRLYRRCDERFAAMLDAGALDEAARLAGRGLAPDLPVMRAIGVPPLLDHLAGRLSLADAGAIARQQTRNLAKRQLTWFRNQNKDWCKSPPGAAFLLNHAL